MLQKARLNTLIFLLTVVFCAQTEVFAQQLTLPKSQRPAWLQDQGLIMAGSWEPLLFRVRRDGSDGYTPTPEQREAYNKEHSAAMVEDLEKIGVNFVMMHCYKGFGLQAEKESMADAVRFSKLCHDAGLHVGVYNYSGAFGWELLFKETPEAENWLIRKPDGSPVTYGRALYRYYWDRNHPDAIKFYKELVRFAVEDIQSDLLHFDNYSVGPGWDENSVRRFRKFLSDNYTPTELQNMGIEDLETLIPPKEEEITPLRCLWLEFQCRSTVDSYYEMGRYARTLREDILLECNPRPVAEKIHPPIHHGWQLSGGEAFWNETGKVPGLQDGKLVTRIPAYKIARRMDNLVFMYCRSPLEIAEAMAFNLDCIGCICWFEYGDIVRMPGSDESIDEAMLPYIRFFKERRDLFRNTQVLADVAVLRSFPSQVFAEEQYANKTAQVEQTLIENRIPFQIIYDNLLDNLQSYQCLVLAGCVALSDSQIQQIEDYIRAGGIVCTVGPAATYDELMRPRSKPAFTGLSEQQFLKINDTGDLIEAIRGLGKKQLAFTIKAPLGVCAEITKTDRSQILHLVNYQEGKPAKDIEAAVAIPDNSKIRKVLLSDPLLPDDKPIDFEQDNSSVRFSIPELNVYAAMQIIFE